MSATFTNRLLSLDEASDKLNVSRSAVYRMFALRRLADIRALASLRCEAGELPVSRAAVTVVLADAVSKIDSLAGRHCDAPGLAKLLPRAWADDIGLDVLHTAAISARTHRLLDDCKAGRLLEVRVEEVREMAARVRVVTLHSIDESPEARAQRRASRRREMARARNARYRERLAQQRFGEKAATERDVLIYIKNVASRQVATFQPPQSTQVRAAIQSGASDLLDVATATGLTLQTIKPLLSRLTKAGQITRVGRAHYAPATPPCLAKSPPLAPDMHEPISHAPSLRTIPMPFEPCPHDPTFRPAGIRERAFMSVMARQTDQQVGMWTARFLRDGRAVAPPSCITLLLGRGGRRLNRPAETSSLSPRASRLALVRSRVGQ